MVVRHGDAILLVLLYDDMRTVCIGGSSGRSSGMLSVQAEGEWKPLLSLLLLMLLL
jgi:hypothetical protein